MGIPARRTLHRQARQSLIRLLTRTWRGARRAIERAVRRFLVALSRAELMRLIRDRAAALAAATALMATVSAQALPPVNLDDVADGDGGFIVNGIDPYDYAGWSVSGAGDVNGDGLDDVIVGAWKAYGNGQGHAGESYVIFGKSDGSPLNLSDVAAGTGGFMISGIDSHDRSGKSVSGAGDVNGDGLDDVIIGAHLADTGNLSATGESYVVFGKADTASVDLNDIVAGNGGFAIFGINANDNSGYSVSGTGDVNGDGLDDVVVGAYARNTSYVVLGKPDGAQVQLSDVAAGIGGFAIMGAEPWDEAGKCVSGAGDVNGDGLSDVLIGAPNAGVSQQTDLGKTYVVFGKVDTSLVRLIDVEGGEDGFAIIGRGGSALSAADAGDVNGDGLSDLVVGAHPYFGDTGEAYVVFGKADGAQVSLWDVAYGAGGFVMHGITLGDKAGRSVAGVGDMNGDGLSDVIVGAYKADADGNGEAGQSYVVFGKADTAAVELSDILAGDGGFALHGINSDDRSGFCVSGAGNVNGDGRADIIVGAHMADPNGADRAGEAYVVFVPRVPCPWDLNGDGTVGPPDLAQVLDTWGPDPDHPADFNGDGVIGPADLAKLLDNWGDCD